MPIAGFVSGGMGFTFTGAVKGVSMTLGQTLLSGGASGIGSILLGVLGYIGIKGGVMSLKKIVIDVVVGGPPSEYPPLLDLGCGHQPESETIAILLERQ
ncbi:hypothetical protein [Anaerosporobacter sp.]|uniref:hypothetical protein n=1 Tax=Anaerosporobacter sp. TaxID=1872529 RepID=UPI00289DF5CF|nr:hypothetical protein [Anaerosporobacter sp.]